MRRLPGVAYCAECDLPAHVDHTSCGESFRARQAEAFAARDSDPAQIVSAAWGRILLERLAREART